MDTSTALLASFLSLVLAYGARLDATHHWFSALAVLCGLRVLIPRRTALRIAIAGAFFGLASFFTQTAGIAGIVALLLGPLWERDVKTKSKKLLILYQLIPIFTFALVLAALSAYWARGVGWRGLWYFQVTYPRYYLHFDHQFLLPAFSHNPSVFVQRLSLYLLLLLIYPAVLWFCWQLRGQGTQQSQITPLVSLALTGEILLLEIVTRLNWNRIYAISIPAIILLLWAISHFESRKALNAALCILTFVLALKQIQSKHFRPQRIADLPAGRAYISPELYEQFVWVRQNTSPGSPFIQAQLLNMYLPLELRPVLYLDGLWQSEITRPEFIARAIQESEQNCVAFVIWSPRFGSRKDLSAAARDHLEPFRDYLADHYSRVYVFSDTDEVWKRRVKCQGS